MKNGFWLVVVAVDTALCLALGLGLGYERGKRAPRPSVLACPSEPSTIAVDHVHFVGTGRDDQRPLIEILKHEDGHNVLTLRDMTCYRHKERQ